MTFILDEITNPHAGTEQQLLLLLHRLDRGVIEPSVLVLRSSRFVDEWPVSACPAASLNVGTMKSPSAFLKLVRLAWRLRRDRVDIVHVLLNDAALVAPLAARLSGARVLASRRDLGFWHTPLLLKLLRVSNLFVDRIVVNSEAVMRVVAECEKYPVDRMAIVRNGFDERRLLSPAHDLRTMLGLGSTARFVGVVANLHRWKRHADLLRAVARLVEQGRDVHAILVGEGPERASLSLLAGRLSISERVHLLGSVADPISHIKALDVAVLCSETEGASNALIEYLCCGVPVVLSDIAANHEVVTPAASAIFYPTGDIEAMAGALGRQLDGAPSSRVRQEQTATTTAYFDSARMAAEFAGIYRALAAVRAPGCSAANDRLDQRAGS